MEQKDPNLPVFLVENTENPTRSKVLHRNMLFPLLTQNLDQTQTSEDTVPENNSSDEESECLGLVEESYKGPMTHSRTKGITTKNC